MISASQTNLSTGRTAGWIFQQLGTPNEDARVDNWLLMSSPWPVLALISAYLLISTQGPKVMEKKKPFDLQLYMIAYNFVLVILSTYTAIEVFIATFLNPQFNGPACAPVDYSNNPSSMRLLSICWLYLITKCIHLSETAVFVLRKKNSQISFLHVYHHASMPILWWITVKHCGGGSAYFPVLINSSVHGVMYFYYLMAAMGEWTRPYLWWKRYITLMQMVQFWVVAIHILHSIYLDCGYPKGYQWLLVAFLITQKVLFMNFYLKAYNNSAARASKKGSSKNE
ncbi:very long chain fatty acid elongase 4-like [Watersipora subatra]|uniref:very long chain fatty acid elongase 4-like n=1 Tax=Watersipora subatra TaxID=2589382 RepID=UPI00355ADA2F